MASSLDSSVFFPSDDMFDVGSVSSPPLVNRAFGEEVIRFRVFTAGLTVGFVEDIVRLLSLREDKKRRPTEN